MKKIVFLFGMVWYVDTFGMSDNHSEFGCFDLSENPSYRTEVNENKEGSTREIRKLKGDLGEAYREILSLESKVDAFERENSNLKKENKELKEEINKLKNNIDSNEKYWKEYVESKNQHKKKSSIDSNSETVEVVLWNKETDVPSKPSYDQLLQIVLRHCKECRNLRDKNNILQKKNEELSKQNILFSDNFNNLKRENFDLNRDNASLRERIAVLIEENDQFNAEREEQNLWDLGDCSSIDFRPISSELRGEFLNNEDFSRNNLLLSNASTKARFVSIPPVIVLNLHPSNWGLFRREEPTQDGAGTLVLKDGTLTIKVYHFAGNAIRLCKAGDGLEFGWRKYGKFIKFKLINDALEEFFLYQNDFANKKSWFFPKPNLKIYSDKSDPASIICSKDSVFEGKSKNVIPYGPGRMLKNTGEVLTGMFENGNYLENN